MRVGMVGADGKKWPSEKEVLVKERIKNILLDERTKLADNPMMYRHGSGLELILVSGHCPVGEERWFCSMTDEWLSGEQIKSHEHQGNNQSNPTYHSFVYDEGGIDSWAEIIADELGIKKEIYPATAKQWECKVVVPVGETHEEFEVRLVGFKSRNIQIAKASDILYVISPKCEHKIDTRFLMEDSMTQYACSRCKGTGRVWNGGEWTGNYAEKLGKKVVRIAI